MRIVTFRGARYEYVQDGCPSFPGKCPNAPHSITVHAIDKRNERKFGPGMTQCLDASKVTEEVPE
jgi:hypothetical protein